MKRIKLTQGFFAIVDDEDFERVAEHKWYTVRGKYTNYAQRKIPLGNRKQKNQYLHSFILPTTSKVDHKDHNGLNCQKENLRSATHAQNNMNRRKGEGSSLFKGVYWDKATCKWMAKIQIEGRTKFLGRFSEEKKAAAAYDKHALEVFGEFSALNFGTSGSIGTAADL